MVARTDIQEAITILSSRVDRLGEETVATAVAALTEKLNRLAGDEGGQAVMSQPRGEQRKQVTILFAELEGFTRLAGTARNTERLRQIDLLWRRLDETIVEYGGQVDKHMGDVVMGYFGVPVARENDPERAVHCALAIRAIARAFSDQQPVDSAPVSGKRMWESLRIGVNTGSVVVGYVGSDTSYTVIGDTVNVASRLKEASADGGVYISFDTYRLVKALFRVDPLGQMSIKGRRNPVSVYRVLEPLPRGLYGVVDAIEGVQVAMIGREAEQDFLRSLLAATFEAGQGRFVTLVGEAGVGKSRLVYEFQRYAETMTNPPVTMTGRTDQRLTQTPFILLRDLLLNRLGIDDSDRPANVQEKLVAGFSIVTGDSIAATLTRHEMAQAIARLISFELPGSELPVDVNLRGQTSQDQALDLLVEFFRSTVDRYGPTVIILEDLHWADDDSLDFLERLALLVREMPLLIVNCTRPMLFDRRVDWPGDLGESSIQLNLAPLSDEESRNLVSHILRRLPNIPAGLIDLIVQSSGGNPFYVEELVKVLIEDGILIPGEPLWRLRSVELARLRIPATLTGLLQARLDRLPEQMRLVIQQAAVVGDEFWDQAVMHINSASRRPLESEQFMTALQYLAQRDMIQRAPSPLFVDTQAYRFRHKLLREVAYESVLLRDRPGYHLQAARWLEAQIEDKVTDYTSVIAQHYESAGEPGDAVRLYERAAVRAAEQNLVGSAIDYYNRALILLRELNHFLDTRIQIQGELGQLLKRDGRLLEAVRAFQSMHRSAELDGDLANQAKAALALADLFGQLADDQQSLDAAEQAEQIARLAGAESVLIGALLARVRILSRLGQPDKAQAIAREAVDRSRAVKNDRALADSLMWLARLHRINGEIAEAEQASTDLNTLGDALRSGPDKPVAAYVLCRRASLDEMAGRYEDARKNLEAALVLQRNEADLTETAGTLRRLGVATIRAGQPAAAVDYLDEATSIADMTGNRYLRLSCRLSMGEALLEWGRYEAAEATLRQVIAVAEDPRHIGRWIHLPEAYNLLVEALNRQGRREEAVWVADKSRLLLGPRRGE